VTEAHGCEQLAQGHYLAVERPGVEFTTSQVASQCLNVLTIKLEFHNADTDTDTDILADILARIVARMSACRSACRRNNFRKSRVSDVSATILARMSVSVSASWTSSFTPPVNRGLVDHSPHRRVCEPFQLLPLRSTPCAPSDECKGRRRIGECGLPVSPNAICDAGAERHNAGAKSAPNLSRKVPYIL